MRASVATSSPYTVAIHTGRLLELRIAGLASIDEVEDLGAKIQHNLQRYSRQNQPVLVADWRRCGVLAPAVAEAVVGLLRRNAPAIERNAMLVSSESSTSVMQLSRIALEAANPKRRVFTDAGSMVAWLGEVLDEPERARLLHFLSWSFDADSEKA